VAVIEYRAIVTKVTSKDGEVYVTSAVDGGRTVRMIYGLQPLLAIVEAVKTEVLQIKDEPGGE
jgi:hypothetical protein